MLVCDCCNQITKNEDMKLAIIGYKDRIDFSKDLCYQCADLAAIELENWISNYAKTKGEKHQK